MTDSQEKDLTTPDVFEGSFRVGKNDSYYVRHYDSNSVIDIPHYKTNKAFNRDRVRVRVTDMDQGVGEVEEILKRSKVGFTGILKKQGERYTLETLDKFDPDITIPMDDVTGEMLNKKVYVTIVRWSEVGPIGKVDKIIGPVGANDTEMLGMALERGFDDEFPEAVDEEARKLEERGITDEDIVGRRDMRDITSFTIDPDDAKDFDDAFSFKKNDDLPAPRPNVFFVYAILCNDDSIYVGQTEDMQTRWKKHLQGTAAEHTKKYTPVKIIHFEELHSREEAVKRESDLKTGFGRKWLQSEYKAGRTRQAGGTYEIGVHIADVSHYVTPGSALDEEAQERTTSVYLVDRTIPMLPEALSNNLCSLRPNEDRLAFSAVFTINDNADVIDEWFGRTIINSDKRFTYVEAQGIIDGGEGLFHEELVTLNTLAKKLTDRRMENGALAMDSAEVEFVLDDEGVPIKVEKKHRIDTNKLVEEFMLMANRRVAKFMAGKTGRSVFVYRVHDKPDPDKMRDLWEFLKTLGYKDLTYKDGVIPSTELNALLREVDDEDLKDSIQTAVVRSMAKAVYTTENIGHYGLGFQFYTHFTSPIRRYPDVLVHRLLQSCLTDKTVDREDFEFYEKMAKHSSEREKDAQHAEWDSIKYKQVEYMSTRIGETYKGTITGFIKFGMFVREKETHAEGMIRFSTMSDGFYEFDEKKMVVRNKSTNKVFHIGDEIPIKVIDTDLDRRIIDYQLIV